MPILCITGSITFYIAFNVFYAGIRFTLIISAVNIEVNGLFYKSLSEVVSAKFSTASYITFHEIYKNNIKNK